MPPRSSFDGEIQISQAYYDAEEIDESAMYHDDDNATHDNQPKKDRIPSWIREDEALGSFFNDERKGGSQYTSSVYTATASFIHPFDFEDHEQDALDHPQRYQRVDNFDFDALPKRIRRRDQSRERIAALEESVSLASPPPVTPKMTSVSIGPTVSAERSYSTIPSTRSTVLSPISPAYDFSFPPQMKVRGLDPRSAPPTVAPTSFLARFQEKCSMKRHRLQPGYLESDTPYSDNDSSRPHSSSAFWASNPSPKSPKQRADNKSVDASLTRASSVSTNESRKKVDEANSTVKELKVKLRLKKINAVPPFKAPLTKIFSPIIQRGQWEIVIRSAIIGFLFAWIIVGSMLAVPVRS